MRPIYPQHIAQVKQVTWLLICCHHTQFILISKSKNWKAFQRYRCAAAGQMPPCTRLRLFPLCRRRTCQ